jgi:photosystem II stability/assembly factor-like uncharacterized protein
MNTKILMIILFILLSCLTVNAQWQQLFPYPTANRILCIEAFSDSNYLIYSKATANSFTSEIFYSSNAGLNWKSIYLDKLNSKNFPFFFNQQFGWVFSYYPERKFWRTTDGGYNWFSYNRPDTSNFPGIYFMNQTTGFITSGGYILKSTDGGEVWNMLYSDTIGGFGREFSVVNENFIVVNGGYFLRKTTDGGKNWTTDTLPLPAGTQVAGVYFTDSLNGFAIPAVQGTFGNVKVLRTTDSGLNWFKILDEDAAYAHYSTIEFYSNTGIIAFGNFEDGSDIFITSDKGITG